MSVFLSLLTSSLYSYSTGKDELLETAIALHQAAMKDEYFIKRRLAPNVDFWYANFRFPKMTLHGYFQEVATHNLMQRPILIRLCSGLIYRAMGKRIDS